MQRFSRYKERVEEQLREEGMMLQMWIEKERKEESHKNERKWCE